MKKDKTPLQTDEVVAAAREYGADDARIADTALLRGIETDPPDLLDPFPRAVALAVRLSDSILDAIDDRPTHLYSAHYRRANALLDEVAMRLTQLLQSRGYAALPIPASVTLDEERNVAALSHKAVTVAAGLGWQGKSLLTVHPRFGPRIRLATVLTDAPLEPHAPIKNRCGKCTRCMDACPAGAIRGVNTDSHYESREEALRFSACVDRLRNENAPMPNIDAPICGVCIRACPFGGAGKS